MATWDTELHFGFRGWNLVAVIGSMMLVAWAVFLGSSVREEPMRCSSGLVAMGARCCAPGQGISAGQCVGAPRECPKGFQNIEFPVPGCVIEARRILIKSGSVTLGPTDWDSVNVIEKSILAAKSFYVDQAEVTAHRYRECVEAGLCPAGATKSEPGLPVTNIPIEQAQAYCAFAGGRLPTSAEWVLAASGEEARRFPWGAHGLVCRRATFGLIDGPCANEGIYPDIAGARSDGATPTGIFDMAGNVAEWTLSHEGDALIYGGSFRSKTASELKVWATADAQISDEVGFRCVYPVRESPSMIDL